jgi:hypothetical protein
MRAVLLIVPCAVLIMGSCIADSGASECSEALRQAMRDQGLSRHQIETICSKADQYARSSDAFFTPDRIRQDLIGWSVGPDAVVKVSPGSRIRSDSGRHTARDVYTTVPLGFVFEQTNIRDISVYEAKIQGAGARVVVHVDTVSQFAGRLRLHYELIAGQWTLRDVENLDFGPK